jgi:outer membrane murein-binding lipoprotein Lpp
MFRHVDILKVIHRHPVDSVDWELYLVDIWLIICFCLNQCVVEKTVLNISKNCVVSGSIVLSQPIFKRNMMKKLTVYPFLLCVLLLAGCSSHSDQNLQIDKDSVTRVIVGSVEHSDQILQKVRELEEAGLLSRVSVLESFPVQIKLTGSVDVVHALETLSRVP